MSKPQRPDFSWTAATAVAAITFGAFSRSLQNGFVNWDDPAVLVNNPHLASPGLLSWAFTTTLIGHYQPLAWVVWSAAQSVFGPGPVTFHVLSVLGHVVNTVLVYVATLALIRAAGSGPAALQGAGAGPPKGAGYGLARGARSAAFVAALAFGVHPVRVEAVAWASAFPYVLSLTALLLSLLTYLSGRRLASLACFAVSLLSRAVAIGFPLVLLVVDLYPLQRHRRSSIGHLVLEKIPFALLAVVAAVVEGRSREIATLQEVGAGARLSMVVAAPFVYLARTLWPIHLSPLDPLPISPAFGIVPFTLGTCGLIAVTLGVWAVRRRWPLGGVLWAGYAVLLAPVVGFVPSGVQATADRYIYMPGVIISIALGVTIAQGWTTRSSTTRHSVWSPASRTAVAISSVLLLGWVALSWQQVGYWHDSIALWTRTADLDPTDDIATYNLAIALAEAGREDESMARYEQTLRLVPDHELARQNLAIIQAAHAERDGDRLAQAGHRAEASDAYTHALALDSKRLHARAARGVILAERGQFEEAVADLTIAFDARVNDPEVPNALAFALMQTGRSAQAVTVLERALTEHPADVGVAHNLARLLATSPDPRVHDGPRALELALNVRERTGGRDPRALDTLAEAYAATGRFDVARETSLKAAALARQLGDEEQAREITAHASHYGAAGK